MTATCPNCGAPIEFRFDDSFVRVCDHCKHAVLRTDRALATLGRVADLAPIESPIRLFSEGHYLNGTFLVAGMAQIRHSAGGTWQEWYAKLGNGRWGWLAEAQGRYYLTFEQSAQVPAMETLAPGAVVSLPVPGRPQPVAFTVAEVGTASYMGARGELPYKLEPGAAFNYVDLSDGHGLFATIDYSDSPPSVYLGMQVSLAQLNLSGGEVIPVDKPKISAKRIACPQCNAPVDIRLPGSSLRVVCGHCNAILDIGSDAAEVIAAQKRTARPQIPLGSRGKLPEGEMTCIAFLQRSAFVDDTWWPFHEYLLHSPDIGYRWLVESDGNWNYVQPVDPGGVVERAKTARYGDVNFRLFQKAEVRVDEVYGEVYWLVEAGETVDAVDYIAPPLMLSREQTTGEVNWSLGTLMQPEQVKEAFGLTVGWPRPSNIAVNAVNISGSAANTLTIAFGLLIALGLVFAARATESIEYAQKITIPAGTSPPPPADPANPTSPPPATSLPSAMPGSSAPADSTPTNTVPTDLADTAPADPASNPHVFFSDPFKLEGGKNIEFTFYAGLNNNWAYIAADLVNVATGAVVDIDANLEYYSGNENGEFWSEGSSTMKTVVAPMPAGDYMLRLESQQGDKFDTNAHVQIRQDIFRSCYLWLGIALLGIPWFGFTLHTWLFERKRWDQSSFGTAGMPMNAAGAGLFVLMAVGFMVVGFFKLAAVLGNDD